MFETTEGTEVHKYMWEDPQLVSFINDMWDTSRESISHCSESQKIALQHVIKIRFFINLEYIITVTILYTLVLNIIRERKLTTSLITVIEAASLRYG